MFCIPKIPHASSVSVSFDKEGNVRQVLVFFRVLMPHIYEMLESKFDGFKIDSITTDGEYVVVILSQSIFAEGDDEVF